ncbi:MAG: RnfABCDGE type electron transport complex subunit D [Cytophagales bacterium]
MHKELNIQGINISLKAFQNLWLDPRHFQIAFQTIFLLAGIAVLSWNLEIHNYLIAIAACLLIQAIGIHYTSKDYSALKSALISALSICLMFKANHMSTFALAGILSISSKFLIRYKGKHIFNPTNFGMILTILITGDAWFSPGQWGSEMLFLFVLMLSASALLLKVGRLDVALSFLGTFSGLYFLKLVVYLGWELDVFIHHLSSGTLLLFTFFMITDPVTTPKSQKGRIIWSSLIGVLAFAISNWYYVHSAPIWALFIMSPLSILINKFYKGKTFSWISK